MWLGDASSINYIFFIFREKKRDRVYVYVKWEMIINETRETIDL